MPRIRKLGPDNLSRERPDLLRGPQVSDGTFRSHQAETACGWSGSSCPTPAGGVTSPGGAWWWGAWCRAGFGVVDVAGRVGRPLSRPRVGFGVDRGGGWLVAGRVGGSSRTTFTRTATKLSWWCWWAGCHVPLVVRRGGRRRGAAVGSCRSGRGACSVVGGGGWWWRRGPPPGGRALRRGGAAGRHVPPVGWPVCCWSMGSWPVVGGRWRARCWLWVGVTSPGVWAGWCRWGWLARGRRRGRRRGGWLSRPLVVWAGRWRFGGLGRAGVAGGRCGFALEAVFV